MRNSYRVCQHASVCVAVAAAKIFVCFYCKCFYAYTAVHAKYFVVICVAKIYLRKIPQITTITGEGEGGASRTATVGCAAVRVPINLYESSVYSL